MTSFLSGPYIFFVSQQLSTWDVLHTTTTTLAKVKSINTSYANSTFWASALWFVEDVHPFTITDLCVPVMSFIRLFTSFKSGCLALWLLMFALDHNRKTLAINMFLLLLSSSLGIAQFLVWFISSITWAMKNYTIVHFGTSFGLEGLPHLEQWFTF